MNDYEILKQRLKDEKLRGEAPEWLHVTGYQLLRHKNYIDEDETLIQRYKFIAEHLSKYIPESFREKAKYKFEHLLISGKYSLSTPALSNIGKPYRGMPIACSGSTVSDNVESFYDNNKEVALLSKNGFGTSVYVGDVRPRGSSITSGGTAEGIVPLMDTFFDTAAKISQGGSRRGSVACYFPIEHPDAREAFRYAENNQKGVNIGVNISDEFIEKYRKREPNAVELFQELCYSRCIGKGYVHFVDRANKALHPAFKNKGLKIKGSNLCAEISLISNDEYSFTCCLSSLNLVHWDNITSEDIKYSLLMLDCINQDFIENCPSYLNKVKHFAEDFRAIGLGVMGLATYMQNKGVVFDSLEGKFLNQRIFKKLYEIGAESNKDMANMLGVPKGLEGYNIRNITQFAIAPTLSTAVIMGGVSQGIEPIFANTYIHESPAGDIRRASPWTYKLLKEKDKWNKEVLDSIVENEGSISHLSFLSDYEKQLGKTAFEQNQYAILRMADDRAIYIDQSQSVNLYFNAHATEKEIGDIHRYAFFDCKYLKSLYYIRSMSLENSKIKHEHACESCAS